MCGIFGIIGKESCSKELIEGISKLEYRGYDSAGLAVFGKAGLKILKNVGKVQGLADKLKASPINGNVGICHTRWATHGKPAEKNSHPHLGDQNKIALVHNGIIENYAELKEQLIKEGFVFHSDTDSEVVAVLIEKVYQGDVKQAVLEVLPLLEGSYALAVFAVAEPNKIIVARQKSPLVIGVGDNVNYLASDAIPIVSHTKTISYLEDGDVAEIFRDKVNLFDQKGVKKELKLEQCLIDPQSIAKDGYDHFMLKEIYEQPQSLENALSGRIKNNRIVLEEKLFDENLIKKIKRIEIVGCGTAWHAGLIGRNMIERLTGIPVQVDYASEFRYRDPIVNDETLLIAISQSGETADTLGAIEVAKEKGAYAIGIINVVGSTMTREVDGVLYSRAGTEVGVASTKAFSNQVLCLYLLGMLIGQSNGKLSAEEVRRRVSNCLALPVAVKELLNKCSHIKEIAKKYAKVDHALFLGRGTGFPVALEGALKLKEISYIHAEGYHAAELKHGPIALIDEDMPVVVLALQGRRYQKIKSNVEEVVARGGKIIAIVSSGDTEMSHYTKDIIEIKDEVGILNSILSVVPMQLLSYYIAVSRGCDVDQPRNLAKSVTVE